MAETGEWQAIARRQCGLISLDQLRGAGVSANQITAMCKACLLERRRPSVYALPGSRDDWVPGLWLAVLAAGGEAVVSHRSAAALHRLDGFDPGLVEVSVPPGRRLRRASAHRVRDLGNDDIVIVAGLPVTSVTRTLADVGAFVDADAVERAVECGLRRQDTSIARLEQIARGLRRSGRRGPTVLATVLGRRPANAAPTESDAETLFLQLTRLAGLPEPERQFPLRLGGRHYRLDFAWPRRRLAVEIDGATTHATPDALGRDLRRQNHIVAGWLLQRFTWEDVAVYADQLVDALRNIWALVSAGPLPLRSAWGDVR